MNILHTVPGRNWGGIEHRVVSQADWLRGQGHRVRIATPPDGETWRRAAALGLAVEPVRFDGAAPLGAGLALRRLVRAHGITVIDCHGNADSKAALLCRGRAAIVRTAHVTPSGRRDALLRLRWRLGHDHVIVTARSICALLRDDGLLHADRTTVIGEWAEPPFFAAPPLDAAAAAGGQEPTVAMVGMLRPDKAPDLALDAFAILQAGAVPARLLIAGAATAEHGAYAEALRVRVAGGALAGVVEFLGYVEDVAALLARSRIVVVPSRREAQSRIAAQAMAAGRPIVATAVGGLPELVRPGETGWLVPPDDPAALADRLAQLARDPAKCAAFGAAARRVAMQHLRMEAQMQRTLSAYASAIAQAAARTGITF